MRLWSNKVKIKKADDYEKFMLKKTGRDMF